MDFESVAPPDFTGLTLAVGQLARLLKTKGVLSELELDACLEEAETGRFAHASALAVSEEYRRKMLLPIRTIRLMNRTWPAGAAPAMDQIALFMLGEIDQI
jgi:hypothetical protein